MKNTIKTMHIRNYLTILFTASLLTCLAQSPERQYDYTFFDNAPISGPYFYSSTEQTEGARIVNFEGKLPVTEDHFFSPPNALELSYENGEGTWSAQIEFERIRGNDFFKPSSHLAFWMYTGETPRDLLPEVAIASIAKARGTNDVVTDIRSKSLPIASYITDKEKGPWSFAKIPLEDFGAFDERINTIVFSNSNAAGEGSVLIDQLELFPDIESGPLNTLNGVAAKGYERHVDITWEPIDDPNVKYVQVYRSTAGGEFTPVGIQRPFISRYTDYTGDRSMTYSYVVSAVNHSYNESDRSDPVSATTRPMTDEELLDMVQEASFRYYWEGAEPHSGLALENIPGRQNMIATGASGFGIMALIVGAERGFITRDQLIERMQTILEFLEGCDKFHGAVSHFIDGPTGKVEPFFGERDNGGDLVETSFLFQGLLTARSYFDRETPAETAIRNSIKNLWEAIEWDWYDREKEDNFLTWHWSPDKEWVIDHKLIGWNETMITYILAIASPTHGVPASMYYNGWASQSTRAQQYRKNWGKTEDGSMYTNGNTYHGIHLPVGVANGGPLFFVHYSYMGLDPHEVTDKYTNYFENNRNIALINWHYCSENPHNYEGHGGDFWGLTASDGPWGYRAIEPRREHDNGTVAPTGALASFPYTPEQSMEALKNMYRNHGEYLWGEYGFKDAVNLDQNWMARIYMGLNQAPVTVMIENYRTGLIWDLFMKNEEIKDAVGQLK